MEKSFVSIPESYKKDTITLSDDEVCEDDNYEINIKVLWRSKRIDRLNIHRVCMSLIYQLIIV